MSLCARCNNPKHRGRCRKAEPKTEAVATPIDPTGLSIDPCAGLRASISDKCLILEQDRIDDDGATYTHTIVLAPHEAAQLINWVQAQVDEAGL